MINLFYFYGLIKENWQSKDRSIDIGIDRMIYKSDIFVET